MNATRFASILATILLSATLASAQCNTRSSCPTGNDNDCMQDCLNQGFRSCRCRQNVVCPRNTKCDCYRNAKNSDEVIDGNESLHELLINMGRNDDLKKVDAREPLDKCSICCGFVNLLKNCCTEYI